MIHTTMTSDNNVLDQHCHDHGNVDEQHSEWFSFFPFVCNEFHNLIRRGGFMTKTKS